MRFGITSRLFLAVLLANVVMALAVGFGVRASFESGFDSYLREREEQRLTRLARVLATAYQEHQGWDFLRDNDETWVSLNQSVRPAPSDRGHPPGMALKGLMPPSRNFDFRGEMRIPPAIVIDAAGNRVVGSADRERELRRHSIEVAGHRVGWLAAPERVAVFDIVDQRFRERQIVAGWTVALLATILSAIVAWFLARGLLAPVRRLAEATRRLADGDYATRVLSNRTDELGRLVDDFNRLGNALEKHETSRRDFMADVSHELRTPIAVLKGELEALQDGVRTLSPASLASLQAEVALLGKLVNDLHDLSLADVGGLAYHFEDVDLSKRLTDCLHAFRDRFAARAIQVDSEIPPDVRVRADSSRLAQVVSNLLENSARYTDHGGRVVVALRTEGNKAVLDIQDSAPGVPAEALPRLFERLFRVESSRNRQLGGSGLGLAISRSVVEAHGGVIVARASTLGGLWIEVRLPLSGEGA
jgi:two-component system sensor histidine kinase BaeS